MYEILRGSYFQRLEDRRREKFEESGDPYWAAPVFFDPHHYVSILDEFVRSGQVPDAPDPWHEDYLERYLREVMADPFVVCSVLGDDIKARVFYDNMLAFMKQIFTREKFRRTCSQGQEQKMKQALQWSERKKRDGWRRLLSEISDEFQEFGFDEGKYRDKFEGEGGTDNHDDWKRMIEDWSKAFERQKQQQLQHDIDEFKDSNTNVLKQNLTQIPEYLEKRNIDKDRCTNAAQMLQQVFALLAGGRYSSADVLWVTDFSIPLCSAEQRKQLLQYRRQGTKFYGLKIGRAFKQGWEAYFDEILALEF